MNLRSQYKNAWQQYLRHTIQLNQPTINIIIKFSQHNTAVYRVARKLAHAYHLPISLTIAAYI